MKKGMWTLFLAILTLFSADTFAQATQPTATGQIPSDSDLAPLTNYLASKVHKTKQSVTLFHWFPANDSFIQTKYGNIFSGTLSSDDPIGLQYVQGMSRRYFDYTAPVPNTYDMYGPGLYAAVDPVATRGYGGPDWVLVQFRLPVGFVMFDLITDGSDTPPTDPTISDALQKAGCPTSWDGPGMINTIFNPAYRPVGSCNLSIVHILNDLLHVDGFIYPYTFTGYKACQVAGVQPPYRQGAWVITDGSKFKASDIRIFNQNTVDDTLERTQIQTAFYQSDADGNSAPIPPFSPQMLTTQFPAYQNWTVNSSWLSCPNNGGPCPPYIYNVTFCSPTPPAPPTPPTPPTPAGAAPVAPVAQIPTPAPSCATVQVTLPVLPPPPMPATITTASPPTSGLLWSDLNGTPTYNNMTSYIQKNYYGCQGKPAYQ